MGGGGLHINEFTGGHPLAASGARGSFTRSSQGHETGSRAQILDHPSHDSSEVVIGGTVHNSTLTPGGSQDHV